MEEPPIIQTEPNPRPKTDLGRIGLYLSTASLGALLIVWLAKPG